MEAKDARHHLVVAGGLMRIDDGSEDLLMHQRAEIKRGMAAAGADSGAAQRHETISQRIPTERDREVKALATEPGE
jgi:hypothetical protein